MPGELRTAFQKLQERTFGSNDQELAFANVSLEDLKKSVVVEYQASGATTGGQDAQTKITKIEIITNESKFEGLKKALNSIGITGMTVFDVFGYGMQKGHSTYYRGVETEADLLPKIRVEVVVSTVPVQEVVDVARKALYTGNIGDGKIFIYNVENVIRVSTGDEGKKALEYPNE
nr:P-II family nitrogen regulator [Trichococcus shcherbakoviae]